MPRREEFHTYFFYALKGDAETPKISGSNLVTVRKAPKKFVEALRKHHEKNGKKVGAILFEYDGQTAYSDYYYPKGSKNRMVENAPGLGAYLEAIAVNHLKKQVGAQEISTAVSPSKSRRAQLRKAGFNGEPPFSAEIGEWLRRTGRIIKGKK